MQAACTRAVLHRSSATCKVAPASRWWEHLRVHHQALGKPQRSGAHGSVRKVCLAHRPLHQWECKLMAAQCRITRSALCARCTCSCNAESKQFRKKGKKTRRELRLCRRAGASESTVSSHAQLCAQGMRCASHDRTGAAWCVQISASLVLCCDTCKACGPLTTVVSCRWPPEQNVCKHARQ